MQPLPFPFKTLAVIFAVILVHLLGRWALGDCGIETCVGASGESSTGVAYLLLGGEGLALLVALPVFIWKVGRWLMTR